MLLVIAALRGWKPLHLHAAADGLLLPVVDAGRGGCGKDHQAVVLEQFVARLPTEKLDWVQYHWPMSLNEAM